MNMKPIPFKSKSKDMSNFDEDPFQPKRDYLCQSVVDFSLRDTKTLEEIVNYTKFEDNKVIDSYLTELSNNQEDSAIILKATERNLVRKKGEIIQD